MVHSSQVALVNKFVVILNGRLTLDHSAPIPFALWFRFETRVPHFSMSAAIQDVTIVGAGLIGLSTALHLLQRRPGTRLTIIEKSDGPASQQSGHNSGVIHSGIYYKPGSFKARFCVKGRASMTSYCEENEIPTWACGKLIVATTPEEEARLEQLYERGKANQVKGLRLVGREEMVEIEPHVAGTNALYAPYTAIVDFTRVARSYAAKVEELGATIRYGNALRDVVAFGDAGRARFSLQTDGAEFHSRTLINCAGLHSDVVAEMSGIAPGLRIIPFRGEYYTLRKSSEHLVKGLIYPVPDPEFPFLGVHLTQTMKGWVEAGPNAVLAMKREGYRKRDFSIRDAARTMSFPGFWKMARNNWKTGVYETARSIRKSMFLKSLQRLMPELTSDDLAPGGSGVRAQAVKPDGSLLDDFHIEQTDAAVHVLNAPSPGATSSLVIGNHIAKLAMELLD